MVLMMWPKLTVWECDESKVAFALELPFFNFKVLQADVDKICF